MITYHNKNMEPAIMPSVLFSAMRDVHIKAWRFRAQEHRGERRPRVEQFRGMWGAAIKEIAPEIYESMFGEGHDRRPLYVLRQARQGRDLELVLIGQHEETTEEAVWHAIHRAGCMGFGREQTPFFVDRVRSLAWDGSAVGDGRWQPGFTLYQMPWPVAEAKSCRLVFRQGLRIVANDRLVTHPTLPQLAVASLRRIALLLPDDLGRQVMATKAEWCRLAESVPTSSWTGKPYVHSRYSGTQGREVTMNCITGGIDLPGGPGPLMPLLAAAWWLHIGKGTIMGLGRMDIEERGSPRQGQKD